MVNTGLIFSYSIRTLHFFRCIILGLIHESLYGMISVRVCIIAHSFCISSVCNIVDAQETFIE